MNEATREALEASIAHWRAAAEIDDPRKAQFGCQNCALCKLFRSKICDGCPVATRTEVPNCVGTPYANAIVWRNRWLFDLEDRGAEAAYRAAARHEAEFLESLRELSKP